MSSTSKPKRAGKKRTPKATADIYHGAWQFCGFLAGLDERDREAIMDRISKIPALAGGAIHLNEFLRLAVCKALQELAETGSLAMPFIPRCLPAKLARRYAELDSVMEFGPGSGVGESVLDDMLEDMIDGTACPLEEAWTFDDPEESRRLYCALINKWRKEDGMKILPLSKLCPKPWPKSEADEVEGGASA